MFSTWITENQQTMAQDTLLALFIVAICLMLYHSNWRAGYAWLRNTFYPWLRQVWGKYMYPIRWLKKWKRHRDKIRSERKAEVRFWTDILCQAGENAVHAGQFSREQIDGWYQTFGKNASLTGLLPKHISFTRKDQRDLKDAILKRIGPEARQAYKEKVSKPKTLTAKMLRYQFKRAFRNAA
jgi:hypothetical protein